MAEVKVDKLIWIVMVGAVGVIISFAGYTQQQNEARFRALELRVNAVEQAYLIRGERIAKLETMSEQNVLDHAEIKSMLRQALAELKR